MVKKVKYSIRPSKGIIALKPIMPFVDRPDEITMNSLSFFDLVNNQFLSDWIDPINLQANHTEESSEHITAITGNLLSSLSIHATPIEISHIDNLPINFLEEQPGSGIAHIHKSSSAGELTVYCRTTDTHRAGDFIYTLGTLASTQESSQMNPEIFSYTLLDKNHKQITLQLSIQCSEEELDIDIPDLGIIQEADLMSGTLAKTRGLLSTPPSRFLPIEQQYSLKSMHLTHHQVPLLYELDESNTKLIAKQAHSQQIIFSAKLEAKGLYDFELYHSIDRPAQTNLLSTHFKLTKSSIYQDIETKAGKIYEFSFYFSPIKDRLNESVELWWGGMFIGIIQILSESLKGYHFTLEGQEDSTRLEFKLPESSGHDALLSTSQIAEHLDMVTLVSEEQPQIKFELGFENQAGIVSQFPITLNLEHEVLISQSAPYTITIDDLSPYKKIVLSDNVVFEDTPATTLNLEKIFSHMQIPESHRQVEIAQLEHSNIYEIKISDKTDKLTLPITVADVELKFDGGNTGLDTLFKYLTIDYN